MRFSGSGWIMDGQVLTITYIGSQTWTGVDGEGCGTWGLQCIGGGCTWSIITPCGTIGGADPDYVIVCSPFSVTYNGILLASCGPCNFSGPWNVVITEV